MSKTTEVATVVDVGGVELHDMVDEQRAAGVVEHSAEAEVGAVQVREPVLVWDRKPGGLS